MYDQVQVSLQYPRTRITNYESQNDHFPGIYRDNMWEKVFPKKNLCSGGLIRVNYFVSYLSFLIYLIIFFVDLAKLFFRR